MITDHRTFSDSATAASPKVSVMMPTYNHEAFIAQALDSVLMQQVDFDYEIVVGEDCSTDNTRAILIEYQKRHPDKIRLLLHERNLGLYGLNNGIETYKACQGQYIALLEGDDYWTSPHKLQKQVDFLDHNPYFSLCFHASQYVYEDGSGKKPLVARPPQGKPYYTLEDLLWHGWFIATASVMFRRGVFGEWPDWSRSVPLGDWVLHILCARHGKIGYIDEAMSVWRIHKAGVWSGMSSIEGLEKEIERCNIVNVSLGFKYDRIIRKQVSNLSYDLAVEYVRRGDLPRAAGAALKSVINDPLNKRRLRKLLHHFWSKR